LVPAGCCLAAIAITGMVKAYPRLYARYHETPHFAISDKPAPESSFELDIGTKEARIHLSSGWGLNEADEKVSWAWALGSRAYIHVPLRPGTANNMEITVTPVWAGDKTQAMTVGLNDHTLETVELKPGIGSYTVRLPGSLTRRVNKIDFRFKCWVSPVGLGGGLDYRPLAVRFFRIRFSPRL